VRSLAVVPIIRGAHVFGIVEAFSTRAAAFSDSQVQELERIAGEIARSESGAPALGNVVEFSRPTMSQDVSAPPEVQSTVEAAAETPRGASEAVSAPTASRHHLHVRRSVVVTLIFLIVALAYFLLPRFPAPEGTASLEPEPSPATARDRNEPPPELLQAAEAGDPVAQYRTGLFYQNDGSAAPSPQALRWFQRAAQSGQPDAQYQLATAYAEGGVDVPQDLPEAYAWYIIAQSHGNAQAAEAIRSLTPRLKRSDIANVRFRVAQMYASGEGTQADVVSAYAWLALAENAAHPGAREAKAQLAKRMNTQQLADATARAESWLARHQPPSR
jgi:hypothetical protein